jgi:hypothetical protein
MLPHELGESCDTRMGYVTDEYWEYALVKAFLDQHPLFAHDVEI